MHQLDICIGKIIAYYNFGFGKTLGTWASLLHTYYTKNTMNIKFTSYQTSNIVICSLLKQCFRFSWLNIHHQDQQQQQQQQQQILFVFVFCFASIASRRKRNINRNTLWQLSKPKLDTILTKLNQFRWAYWIANE